MIIQVHLYVVFFTIFSLSVHHLNDSIYIGNCCDQEQSLNKKSNHEVSYMKRFQLPIQKI